MTGSNRRHSACKADALPAELITQSGFNKLTKSMADRTGLEPATPGVTGRYSNQLNYRSAKLTVNSGQTDNLKMVGDDGIEPPTFCV